VCAASVAISAPGKSHVQEAHAAALAGLLGATAAVSVDCRVAVANLLVDNVVAVASDVVVGDAASAASASAAAAVVGVAAVQAALAVETEFLEPADAKANYPAASPSVQSPHHVGGTDMAGDGTAAAVEFGALATCQAAQASEPAAVAASNASSAAAAARPPGAFRAAQAAQMSTAKVADDAAATAPAAVGFAPTAPTLTAEVSAPAAVEYVPPVQMSTAVVAAFADWGSVHRKKSVSDPRVQDRGKATAPQNQGIAAEPDEAPTAAPNYVA